MAKMKICDLCIIGAGPAGMTAAIYAGRADKSVIIVDKDGFGGNIAKSPKVENIPGFASISGIDFASKMFDQMMNLQNVEYNTGEVVKVNKVGRKFTVVLNDGVKIKCKSVIFATGTKPRKLKLDLKDIYYCVTCDGPFFKGKDVLVVGSGNTGATYALELSTYCNHVYICDVTKDMMCERTLVERIKNRSNITFLTESFITSGTVNNEGNLESVIINGVRTIDVSAIFSAIGMEPQTKLGENYFNLTENSYFNDSTTEGAFAAGDCTDNKVKQVTTAVASGTVAAINAIRYLNTK